MESGNRKQGRLGYVAMFVGMGLSLCLATLILSEVFAPAAWTPTSVATMPMLRTVVVPTLPFAQPTVVIPSQSITPEPTFTQLPTMSPISKRTPTSSIAPVSPTQTPFIVTATPGPTQTPWVVTSTPLPSSPTALPLPTATEAPTVQAKLDITYPGEIYFEKVGSVTVMIAPNPQIALLPTSGTNRAALFSIETTTQEGNQKTVSEEIKMFPYMLADLRAPNFDVVQSQAAPWQPIVFAKPAVWTWDLNPKKVGTQEFTVDVFGSDVITGELRTFVKQYKREIEVLDKPFPQNLMDFLKANFGTILGSLGSGGFLFWLLTRRQKKRRSIERSRD